MSAFICSEKHFNYILSSVYSIALKRRYESHLYIPCDLLFRDLKKTFDFSILNSIKSSNYYVFNLKNKDHLKIIYAILLTENIYSVNSRYNDSTSFINFSYSQIQNTSIPQANTLLRSLDYQSCESDDYDRSLAKTLIKDLRLFLLDFYIETNCKEINLEWAID